MAANKGAKEGKISVAQKKGRRETGGGWREVDRERAREKRRKVRGGI